MAVCIRPWMSRVCLEYLMFDKMRRRTLEADSHFLVEIISPHRLTINDRRLEGVGSRSLYIYMPNSTYWFFAFLVSRFLFSSFTLILKPTEIVMHYPKKTLTNRVLDEKIMG